MAFKFNPFTGTFDQTGSSGGASYIDGEKATYAELSLDATAPLDSAWLVRTATNSWFGGGNKPAGIYIRTSTAGSSRDTDYTYAGTMPDVFSDANFTLYDNADTSKNLKFQLSGLSASTTSTLTVPNASGTLALTSTFASPPAIGSATAAAANFTTLGASGIITAANSSAFPPTTTTDAKGLQWTSIAGGTNQAAIYGGYAGVPALGIGIGTGAGSLTEVARFASTGATISGGTVTASAPVLDLSQTWNNAAVAFTALRLDITNTASLSAGSGACRFLDVRIGGTSQIRFERNFSVPVLYFGSTDTGLGASSTILNFYANGGAVMSLASGGSGPVIRSDGAFSWASSTNITSSIDCSLTRDAADTLAQRRGTNFQTFRLYSTYTDASNYERGFMRWSGAGGTLQIGTEKLGTGSARALELSVDGTTRLTISASTGNTSIQSGNSLIFTSCGRLVPTGTDGVMSLVDFANTGWNRLNFGGTTTSFPALKRSSTTLQVRLADDSAFAAIQGKLTTDTAYTATTVTPTGYVTIYDSTGTAYKVPCVL